MTKEEFYKELEFLNIVLNSLQKDQLEAYYNMLIEWNKKINLTRITNKGDVYLKHFFDSISLVKIIDLKEVRSLCDVGTGAGFPGIVLKIVYPDLEITLVDSLQKRTKYLNEVIRELKLEKIEVIHSRIEEYGKNNREKFDVVTARAVAPMSTLLEYCIPITKKGGKFIAMKANISQEIIIIEKLKDKMFIKLEEVKEFYLPIENSKRTLIKIKKTKTTPKMYPRNANIIKKEPLK